MYRLFVLISYARQMQKRWMRMILLLIIILGVGGYMYTQKSAMPNWDDANNGDNVAENNGDAAWTGSDELADLRAANAEEVDTLQVDVTMTNSDGTDQWTMQIITDGTVTKMVATSAEWTATIIYTSWASYMQMEGRDDWIMLPSLDQQPIQPVTFQANKLAEVWAQNADVKFLGTQDCDICEEGDDCGAPVHCDVYQGKDESGTSEVFFNKEDNLLAKVVAHQPDGTTATMVYTYDVVVNVDIPTNIQEFDIWSFQQAAEQAQAESDKKQPLLPQ